MESGFEQGGAKGDLPKHAHEAHPGRQCDPVQPERYALLFARYYRLLVLIEE